MSDPLKVVTCQPEVILPTAAGISSSLLVCDKYQPPPEHEADKMLRDPEFKAVEKFVEALKLTKKEELVELMRRRFAVTPARLRQSRYWEFVRIVASRRKDDKAMDRLFYASYLVRYSLSPDPSKFSFDDLTYLVDAAQKDTVSRLSTITSALRQRSEAFQAIIDACRFYQISDLNHISYILATAWRESAFNSMKLELYNAYEEEPNPTYKKDAYFFSKVDNPEKASYNSQFKGKDKDGKAVYGPVNGNEMAGEQINRRRAAMNPPKELLKGDELLAWNSTKYPTSASDDVKAEAHSCDFLKFIGRGFLQLTWKGNYQKFSNLAEFGGVDFTDDINIEKVRDLDISAKILVKALRDGLVRRTDSAGKTLMDFNEDRSPFFNFRGARRLVSKDAAEEVATVAQGYRGAFVIFPDLDGTSPDES